ncbi:hypothetical protein TOPH_07561 [Tolypocladium ophioglossoides CBS 100239]|uniref:Secreted protein n=1 Tax=Tolypocladium ophioglossoides (strain CBS 100239) TaxID=1163406 RepID=A0A0L0N115_TOLOC|nr:hypothetical protein TOPH_07561 [Tolypocladium ophioglossoides CBS 100239]
MRASSVVLRTSYVLLLFVLVSPPPTLDPGSIDNVQQQVTENPSAPLLLLLLLVAITRTAAQRCVESRGAGHHHARRLAPLRGKAVSIRIILNSRADPEATNRPALLPPSHSPITGRNGISPDRTWANPSPQPRLASTPAGHLQHHQPVLPVRCFSRLGFDSPRLVPSRLASSPAPAAMPIVLAVPVAVQIP